MKKRVRLPRKLVLVAGAGVASMTLNGCLFTSGNLMAPPPCDDAGHYDCPPDAGHDAGRADDAGADAGGGDAGNAEDAGSGDAGSDDASSGDAGSDDAGSDDAGP